MYSSSRQSRRLVSVFSTSVAPQQRQMQTLYTFKHNIDVDVKQKSAATP